MSYTVQHRPSALKDTLSLIAELMRPSFNEWELLQVRELVRHDMQQCRANPEMWALEMIRHTAYGGLGLGRTLYCPEYNVGNLYPEDLARYALNRFVGSNIVVVGTGSHTELCIAVDGTLGALQAHPLSVFNREDSPYVGGRRTELGDGQMSIYSEAYDSSAFGGDGSFLSSIVTQIAGGFDSRPLTPGNHLTSAIAKIIADQPYNPNLLRIRCFTLGKKPGLFGFCGFGRGPVREIADTVRRVVSRLSAHLTERNIRRARLHLVHQSEHRMSFRSGFLGSVYAIHPRTEFESQDVSPLIAQETLRRVFSTRPTVYASGNLSGMHDRYFH
jgi:hypothetical protein